MVYEEWLRSFKRDRIKPVYIIAAQEYFLTRRVVERIKDALWGEVGGETNYRRLDGGEAELVELLEAVNTAPFLGGRRLVVLDDADAFTKRLSPKEGEALLNYLASPNPTTTLLMVFDATDRKEWKDKYLKWTRGIKGTGDFVDCRRIYESQIPGWVRDLARDMGIKLSREALEYLGTHLGTDIQSIYTELEKLQIHAHSGSPLSLEQVQGVVGDRRQGDIFSFQHYLGEGDVAAALQMLDKLLTEGEEGPRLISSIFSYFKRLLQVKELDGLGEATQGNLAKITRTTYGRANDRFLEASRRFSKESLLRVFPRLLQADVEMKTGGPRADEALPALVAELCERV